MKRNSFIILPLFIFSIAVFRFIYLENGLSLIIKTCYPIFAGLIIAAVLNPVLVFIEETLKIKNRYVGVILTYMFVFFILSLILTIVTPNIINSIKQLSTDIPKLYFKASELLSPLGEDVLLKIYFDEIAQKISSLLTSLINNALMKVIDVFTALANTLLSLIISVYILIDKKNIENWIIEFSSAFLGKKKR